MMSNKPQKDGTKEVPVEEFDKLMAEMKARAEELEGFTGTWTLKPGDHVIMKNLIKKL